MTSFISSLPDKHVGYVLFTRPETLIAGVYIGGLVHAGATCMYMHC